MLSKRQKGGTLTQRHCRSSLPHTATLQAELRCSFEEIVGSQLRLPFSVFTIAPALYRTSLSRKVRRMFSSERRCKPTSCPCAWIPAWSILPRRPPRSYLPYALTPRSFLPLKSNSRSSLALKFHSRSFLPMMSKCRPRLTRPTSVIPPAFFTSSSLHSQCQGNHHIRRDA